MHVLFIARFPRRFMTDRAVISRRAARIPNFFPDVDPDHFFAEISYL